MAVGCLARDSNERNTRLSSWSSPPDSPPCQMQRELTFWVYEGRKKKEEVGEKPKQRSTSPNRSSQEGSSEQVVVVVQSIGSGWGELPLAP